MVDAATAFVPGHVTGFFSAHPHDDPTKAGSRGAGLTLTDGVTVTVRPAATSSLHLEGPGGTDTGDEPVSDGDGRTDTGGGGEAGVSIESVRIALETLSVDARIEVESDLPIGAGFGVSGAITLGTALAANRVFDRGLSENELVTVAHGAEVRAGTGLGDVVAQARGGIPIRLEPGAPAHNALDGIPDRTRVEYLTFGDVSTAEVLDGEIDRLNRAGEEALSRVVGEPTLTSFVYASRRFAREAGLLTEPVGETIAAVADAGGQASMAMLGETVFALGTGLSEAGYDPSVCGVHPAGATLRSVK